MNGAKPLFYFIIIIIRNLSQFFNQKSMLLKSSLIFLKTFFSLKKKKFQMYHFTNGSAIPYCNHKIYVPIELTTLGGILNFLFDYTLMQF